MIRYIYEIVYWIPQLVGGCSDGTPIFSGTYCLNADVANRFSLGREIYELRVEYTTNGWPNDRIINSCEYKGFSIKRLYDTHKYRRRNDHFKILDKDGNVIKRFDIDGQYDHDLFIEALNYIDSYCHMRNSGSMQDTEDFAVGTRVLIVNSNYNEFIGLYGSIASGHNFKPEYVQTFGTDKFFRVNFDGPIIVKGKTYESGIFKKTDLKHAE